MNQEREILLEKGFIVAGFEALRIYRTRPESAQRIVELLVNCTHTPNFVTSLALTISASVASNGEGAIIHLEAASVITRLMMKRIGQKEHDLTNGQEKTDKDKRRIRALLDSEKNRIRYLLKKNTTMRRELEIFRTRVVSGTHQLVGPWGGTVDVVASMRRSCAKRIYLTEEEPDAKEVLDMINQELTNVS